MNPIHAFVILRKSRKNSKFWMHPRSEVVRRLALLRQSKWRRERLDEIIIKGRKQIESVVKQSPDVRFKEILVSNRMEDYGFLSNFSAHRIKRVDPKLLYYISYQSKPIAPKSSPGQSEEIEDEILSNPSIADSLMVATLPKPSDELPTDMRFVLCLNDVIFPDNVGSLIQSAHAIGGVDAIIGTEKTCDYYGWKVLEASKGMGFNIPKKRFADISTIKKLAVEQSLLPIVGDTKNGVEISSVDTSKYSGMMVIVGNERHGPSKEILEFATPVRIPISIHSLNASVAGGILLQLAKAHR